jgi:hypothetical protein
LALAVRQAIVNETKPDLMWWTTQEWEILDEESVRKDIISKLKLL